MKLHSYSGVITNSSTETYAMADSPDTIYEMFQLILDAAGVKQDVKDLVSIEVRIEDWRFNDYVAEKEGIEYTDYEDRKAYEEAIRAEWHKHTQEDVMKWYEDNSDSWNPVYFGTYYLIKFKGNEDVLKIGGNDLFALYAEYNG